MRSTYYQDSLVYCMHGGDRMRSTYYQDSLVYCMYRGQNEEYLLSGQSCVQYPWEETE